MSLCRKGSQEREASLHDACVVTDPSSSASRTFPLGPFQTPQSQSHTHTLLRRCATPYRNHTQLASKVPDSLTDLLTDLVTDSVTASKKSPTHCGPRLAVSTFCHIGNDRGKMHLGFRVLGCSGVRVQGVGV